MEQAMAYVCCPAEESRVKVQRYCRKIYELGYVPICPRFGFLPFLDEGEAEDQQAYNRMSHLILKRCRMVVVCGKEVTVFALYCPASRSFCVSYFAFAF